eukprot:TRINITY_DN2106_c0_g1_i14.p1 TRINITY_DN2106_c0_g1~~TRINITY_DN2106_c0_g1_i14.p1  ORF type:complete len:492 (+),score=61.13 TRINITY_DN2106_c0_g1_i14:227-1702(+)
MCELKEQKSTNLQIAAIWINQVNQGIQVTLALTIGVYMVRHFMDENTAESQISLLTGLLGAMFTISQFCTAYGWGLLSDRIGRKLVLQIGNLSCMLSMLLFGLSPMYVLACLSRFAGGFFNGVIGAQKTIIGESFDVQQQTMVMGVMSFGWGMGCIVGPSVGGLLSEPCERFGNHLAGCGDGGFLVRQPYVLPCVVAAFTQLCGILISAFWIPETCPRMIAKRKPYKQLDEEALELEESDQEKEESRELELVNLKPIIEQGEHFESSQSSLKTSSYAEEEMPIVLAIDDLDDDQVQKPMNKEQNNKGQHQEADDQKDIIFEEDEDFDLIIPWYRLENVRKTILGYGIIAFVTNVLDETIPIFASTPVGLGGLGISPHELSIPLIIGGVVLMINSMLVIPKVTKRLGIIRSARLSLYGGGVIVAFIPSASFLAFNMHLSIAALALNMALRTIFISFTFTCSMIMVNSASPRNQIGTVNGVGQTIAWTFESIS